jgi:hypothetical protein
MEFFKLPMSDFPGPWSRDWFLLVCDARGISAELDEALGQWVSQVSGSGESFQDRSIWLRGVAIVSPQPSDAVAIPLLPARILTIEDDSKSEPLGLVRAVLRQVLDMQGTLASDPPKALMERGGPGPLVAAALNPARGGSPFSRAPAYFDRALYQTWVADLAKPWDPHDPWNAES